MSGRLFRALTPLGWLAAALAVAALLSALGGGLGLRWDLLRLQARRLEATEQRLEQARSQAAARRLEAAARGRQIESLDAFHRNTLAVTEATVAAETKARIADDAETPLDPARAERLRGHDRELCRLSPAVAGCAAPVDPG
ncbi:hypothetical protein ACWGLL_02850 [Brevundimonas sp. NPDC055814]